MEQIIVKQVRYYYGNNKYPSALVVANELISQLFSDQQGARIKLVQIQALSFPGATLILSYNNSSDTSVIVGSIGKYEMNFNDNEILNATGLKIDADTINYIDNHEGAFIILNLAFKQEALNE